MLSGDPSTALCTVWCSPEHSAFVSVHPTALRVCFGVFYKPSVCPEPLFSSALCGFLGTPEGWRGGVSGWAAPSSADVSPMEWASGWLGASRLASALEPSVVPSTASFLPAWPRKDALGEQEQVAAPAFAALLEAERLVSEETVMLPKVHPFCSWSDPRQPVFVCRTL